MFQTYKKSMKDGNLFNCHGENHEIMLAGGFFFCWLSIVWFVSVCQSKYL